MLPKSISPLRTIVEPLEKAIGVITLFRGSFSFVVIMSLQFVLRGTSISNGCRFVPFCVELTCL